MVTEIYLARKYCRMHTKCTEKHLPFNLTLADLRKLYKRKTCAYTGVEMLWDKPNGADQSDVYPTIDRIDPSKGYTKGNVVLCCYRINQLKDNLTVKELQGIAAYVNKVSN